MELPDHVCRIRLAREVDGTLVEVWLQSADNLKESIQLLETLCRRVLQEKLRLTLEPLWVRGVDGSRIRDSVSDAVHRVALSLFDSWPEPKRVTDIQTETGLVQGYVSDILAGRSGGSGGWFQKIDRNWKLSSRGENELKLLGPTLLDADGIEHGGGTDVGR